MPNDSIESLFEDAVNASENPNEGRDAAKFITAAPKINVDDDNEIRLQKKKEESERIAKQKEEERKREIQLAEEKRKKELESRAAEERAKAEAQKRVEEQKQEQLERERRQADELKKQKAVEEKRQEQLQKEREEKAAQIQKEEEQKARMKAEEQKRLDEKERISRLSGNPFSVDKVSLVLTVSDSYRGYDLSSQQAVQAFFNEESEANIVSAVLNETNEIRAALHSLILAQQAEQVDRAFLLVSLDVNLLTNMGKIMMTYTGAELPMAALPGNRIEYCRSLEKAISSMSPDQQANLEAIQKLLAIPSK